MSFISIKKIPQYRQFIFVLLMLINLDSWAVRKSQYLMAIEDTPLIKEISDKLTLAKEIVKDTCYNRSSSPPFSATTYSIASGNQRWVTEWGCTNTNGSLTNLVAGYVLIRDHSGFLSKAKIMVVALDQTHTRINSDDGSIATKRITDWCLHIIDTDTGDDVAVSKDIDMDSSGSAETDLNNVFNYIDCGVLS